MKRIHLLRVNAPPPQFSTLAAELERRGEKLGWLEWHPEQAAPAGPQQLQEAAELKVLRAVAIGYSGSVTVKPMHGTPVLKDVVREYFRGCLAVLVCSGGVVLDFQGDQSQAPFLKIENEILHIQTGEQTLQLDACQLSDRLRRPKPFA